MISLPLRKLSFLAFSLLLAFETFAQAPRWTDYSARKSMFPASSYVMGFNSERNVSAAYADQTLEDLKEYVRIQLIESINVTIKSIGTVNITNVNSKTHEFFKKTSASYSKVNLTGLQVETYYDKKRKEAFAIAYAEKAKLIESYHNALKKDSESVGRKVEIAKAFEAKSDYQNALKHYFETLPLFRQIEEAFTLMLALDPAHSATLEPIVNDVNALKLGVNQGIAALQKADNLSLDDVAYMMAKGYQLQLKPTEQNISLSNFTYQDTKMTSPLSRRWSDVFEKKLVDVASMPMTRASSNTFYQGNPFKEQQKRDIGYVMTGTFWKEGGKLKIISILREVGTGKALASMEGSLSLQWLAQNNISAKPQNFEEAYSELKVFSKDEIVGGGLLVDVWTNKGGENLLFSEGDIMKIYIKANKPGYVRFIYHAADGSKVLLLDNYYLDQSKVNKVYEIPEEFTCTGPFGVETLQVNVQTEKFPALRTQSMHGYDFIVEGLEDIIAKRRGFKKSKKVLTAEHRLMITTMPQ